MPAINWATYLERAVGRGHPTLTDTVNRPLRELLTNSGYTPDSSTLDLRQIVGPIQIINAATALDVAIRRDAATGLIRLIGGTNGGDSGQIRVKGRAMGQAYDVDCYTPNAVAAETFRWGIAGGLDWPSLDIRNISQINVSQTAALSASGWFFGFQAAQTIPSGAVDGSALRIGCWANGQYLATDATDAKEVKYVGHHSTQIYGGVGGAAAKGSVWNYGATMSVQGSGSSQNELACYFGGMSAGNGSDFRAWFTDYTLLGPTTGIQMNLAGGVTMLINNYFNGVMASQGNVACFNAVTRPGQGAGASVGEWAGKTTYAVDFGFQVTGWAGTAGAKTAGFTVAFMAGGSGGMWNAALNGLGVPDANSVSVLGTALEGRDLTTWGVNLHHPNVATAKGFGITQGTWDTGLDLSGATFTVNAIKTGTGPVQFGDRVGIGAAAATDRHVFIGGTPPALAGTTQSGLVMNPGFTSAATTEVATLRPLFTADGAFTITSAYIVRVQAPSLLNGAAVTTLYGIKVNDITQGASGNYAIHTGSGIVRFGDFIEGPEIADPVAPGANNGRLYFRDNGSGKTQLVARFNTGVVQVIATEP